MRFSPKDIVLLPFPFTHFDSDKIRPALILSKQNIYGDYVVIFLTSQVKKYEKNKENIFIKKSEINNLLADSLAIPSKIATLSESMMVEKIGVVDLKEWSKVKNELKKVLGI
jgi:mRNA interferase MazF